MEQGDEFMKELKHFIVTLTNNNQEIKSVACFRKETQNEAIKYALETYKTTIDNIKKIEVQELKKVKKPNLKEVRKNEYIG
ncbi:hypothetical protein P5624_00215 (plasmid) [Bacillus subtilis]|nr:hypothetical protein P5624_00215 [Bacillus subtilis]